ncbi:actin-binding protein IPP isoform X2 [Drosophila nasuta]|uniref:actin-binding protein IPP isoform X2 n=1 Tax=Drosophila nasuta TaxID=42062 RepID=UPI00295E2710|nr:actin-binding protein IPP isoform X2 [Drosophila nasuta]
MPPLKSYSIHHEFNANANCHNGNDNSTDNDNDYFNQPAAAAAAATSTQRTNLPSYCNAQYPFKVLANLNQLREQSRFCDIEIVAGESTFNAHRAILSAASAYFEAMFRPELGLNEVKQKSVVLHTIDGDIFFILLDFIYTGRCEITQSNVQELLAAADMLQLNEVVDGCCEFLCRELHATNALGILRFAEAHNCESLAKSAMNFVQANFPAITLEDEFLETPQNLLSQLLNSELLRVDSESQVFQAALRWIKHDVTQRRCYVFDILSHVRMALVPVKVIDKALKDDCRDMSVKVALRSICRDIASKRGQLVPLRVCPRQLAKKNIYIIGGSHRDTPRTWNSTDCTFETVAKFDIFRREWSETAPMEVGRILPGVSALNGKIYVVGGERGSQILANGEVYDPQNDIWQPIAPMIVPRCEFGLCTMGGNLFAVGGWFGDDIGGTMECYDPEKDLWKLIGSMPQPRFSMGVVSFEGLIYIVGGCTTTTRHLPDLISYNPVTKEWTQLARMQTARCQMGVAVLDRYLYVVGGSSISQDILSSVERYNFDDDKWSTVCALNVPRAIPAVAAADGLLYVAGGGQPCEVNFYRAQVTISAVECYDPLSDTWKNCPDLPVSRSEAGAVVV